jgi:hypothetical protein
MYVLVKAAVVAHFHFMHITYIMKCPNGFGEDFMFLIYID